jgi:ABC-type uncharacterized transport system substrate-binding protein
MAAIAFLGLTTDSTAHPHVWITVEMTLLHDKDGFTSLQHKWKFDEYYTATALEGISKNQDGAYDARQLAELAKVNIDGLKEFGYFTYAVLGDEAIKLGEPGNYWLEHTNGALSLVYTLPFAQPVAPTPNKDLRILVLDPTYFIAFELAKVDPIRLAQGAPASCKAKIEELAEGSEEAQRLSKAFAELGPELGYTQISAIGCRAR